MSSTVAAAGNVRGCSAGGDDDGGGRCCRGPGVRYGVGHGDGLRRRRLAGRCLLAATAGHHGFLQVGVTPSTPAVDMPVLWVNAAQFEEGTEPTEYTLDVYNLDNTAWMSLE